MVISPRCFKLQALQQRLVVVSKLCKPIWSYYFKNALKQRKQPKRNNPLKTPFKNTIKQSLTLRNYQPQSCIFPANKLLLQEEKRQFPISIPVLIRSKRRENFTLAISAIAIKLISEKHTQIACCNQVDCQKRQKD